MIPEEIEYPVLIPPPHSPYIINRDLFNEDLEKRKITKYEVTMSHKGSLYYKNPEAYYGPVNTYSSIPSYNDIKFETDVQVENLDDMMKNENQIKEDLVEAEKELSNLLMFNDGPKFTFNATVKDNYALPYYDPTYEDKIIRIRQLKNQILYLREKLGFNSKDVGFYIEVKNTTFPRHSDDLLNNYHKTYYHLKENVTSTKDMFENGNITDIDDLYNVRHHYLKSYDNPALSIFNSKNTSTSADDIRKMFTESLRNLNPVPTVPFAQTTPQFNFNNVGKSKFMSDESSDLNKENKSQSNINKPPNTQIKLNINNTPVNQINNDLNSNKPTEIKANNNATSKKEDKKSNIDTDEDDINNLL